jgi:putative flippase GtrA
MQDTFLGKHHQRIMKLLRFCLVGGTAFLLSLLVFNLLKNYIDFFGKYLGIASILGDLCGLVYGFYVNKHWTYSTQRKEGEKYFFRYMSLYASTIFINWLLLKAFLWILTYHALSLAYLDQNIKENIAKISATAITTVLNFAGTNYIIFSHDDEKDEEEEEIRDEQLTSQE